LLSTIVPVAWQPLGAILTRASLGNAKLTRLELRKGGSKLDLSWSEITPGRGTAKGKAEEEIVSQL
jgi:hypothetical protein